MTSLSMPLFGQTVTSVTDIGESRKRAVIENYQQEDVARVLSGKHYTLKQLHAINSQMLDGANPEPGSMIYDGIMFNNVVMQYDLATQQIIVLLESGNNEKYASIDTEKVSSFSILGKNFTQISGDSVVAKGIYELAFDGQFAQLFIKRLKTKNTSIRSEEIIVEFIPSNKFFVKNQFGWFEVANKKSLLASFENNEEVRSVLKQNKVKFSKNKIEQGLILTLSLLENQHSGIK